MNFQVVDTDWSNAFRPFGIATATATSTATASTATASTTASASSAATASSNATASAAIASAATASTATANPTAEFLRPTEPRRRETFDLPNVGSTQAFLAWAHEHGTVIETAYGSDRVRVVFEGKPTVVSEAASRAATLRARSSGS